MFRRGRRKVDDFDAEIAAHLQIEIDRLQDEEGLSREDARAAALPIWLKHYNSTRNHSSLSNRPPISRVRNQPRHDT